MKESQTNQTTENNSEQKTKSEQQDPKEIQIKDLINTVKHVQADFENYKKRIEREKQETCLSASKDVIIKLLPLLNHFELAVKNKDNVDEYIKGTELIYAEMVEILHNLGVQVIETEHQQFDPSKHEALLRVESKEKPNTIIEELQKGYTLHGKVIRYAKVKVAK